jgi:hypothetical protein
MFSKLWHGDHLLTMATWLLDEKAANFRVIIFII